MVKPINFSLPGVGLLAMVSKRYETLTDEFIQQWLYDLYRDWMVTPDYLLVSQKGRDELHRMVMEDLHMYHWVVRNIEDERGERVERYPNKVNGSPLSIVVFPGLPENTLFLASILKMAHEEVQYPRPGSVKITRSYERL